MAGSNFDRFLGNGFSDCISPVNGGEVLDCLAAFTMNRPQYRWFGDKASVVLNTTVNAGGDRAGIRWAEAQSTDGDSGWTLAQDGTYAPADGVHRWMGSAAMDGSGNIAGGVLVFHDVSESRELNRRLSYHASHDILTGLVNRREFESRLELGRGRDGWIGHTQPRRIAARSLAATVFPLEDVKRIAHSQGQLDRRQVRPRQCQRVLEGKWLRQRRQFGSPRGTADQQHQCGKIPAQTSAHQGAERL